MQKYSVLMSLYIKEKPEYLNSAIKSMVEQILKPDEIVIVKDGKITAELQQVLDKYDNENPGLFNIVGYEKNRGLGLALNYGLECCKNELVARMDTDDISMPNRCMKQVKAFEEHPEYAIVGSAVDEFYGTPENITARRVVPCTPDEIYEFAKRRSAFNHPSVMYRKSKVLEFNGYSDLRRNQDVDLFGRMLFGGCKAANFNESLLWFRSDENLARRRKSWGNTFSYIATIRKFWKMGYSSLGDYVIVGIAQTGMYFMPVSMQNYVYKKFLRK
ncbi:glycosyltransferase [Clostridium tertium]|uniref:glycosyltransferase n=1 Tax=Clostridium tertium TaxID=1559 RepID=UPI003522A6E6